MKLIMSEEKYAALQKAVREMQNTPVRIDIHGNLFDLSFKQVRWYSDFNLTSGPEITPVSSKGFVKLMEGLRIDFGFLKASEQIKSIVGAWKDKIDKWFEGYPPEAKSSILFCYDSYSVYASKQKAVNAELEKQVENLRKRGFTVTK